MIYSMKCDTCGKQLDIGCPVDRWETYIKPGIVCNDPSITASCDGMLRQIITPPKVIFGREPFPRDAPNEVQLPTPYGEDKRFDDKHHAREWLGERGLTSKWIENDM